MESLMRSGDFARLCRTTKETLRHYDKLGLLCPIARIENGYKLYSVSQCTDFFLISALQSTGLSLADIGDFLHEFSSDRLYEVLGSQIEVIANQQRELEHKRQMLERALDQVQTLQGWFVPGRARETPEGYLWRTVTCAEEFFIETAAPYGEDREDDFLSAVTEHLDYCERQGWGVTFQEAYRVDEAHILTRQYAEGFYAEARVPEAVSSPRLRIKPAGRYLQLLNKIELKPYMDSYTESLLNELSKQPTVAEEQPLANPMFEAYDALLAFAQEQGITLVGDLYDVVLSLYGGNKTDVIFTEVSMRIA